MKIHALGRNIQYAMRRARAICFLLAGRFDESLRLSACGLLYASRSLAGFTADILDITHIFRSERRRRVLPRERFDD